MQIGRGQEFLSREGTLPPSGSGDLQETSPDRRAWVVELMKTHVSNVGARCGFAGGKLGVLGEQLRCS